MPTISGLPKGFSYSFDSNGNVIISPPDEVKNIVSRAHDAMTSAGSMIPTPLAVGATIGLSPTIYQAGAALAASIALQDPVGMIANGIPLAASLVSAGYAIFTKTQRPTNEQITTYISSLNRDELVRLLDHDAGNIG